MGRRSTALLWTGTILLLGAYLFPLWRISLDAPQYPEGMGMRIWIDKVTGEKPHDLQTINGLNHYIGMRAIDANSIPELRFMKFIVGALVVLGAAAALSRKIALAAGWVVLCLAVSFVGLADFYKWGYEYGHQLDPNAPIKVPGMAYQPPLIGTKQMLNITATSLPDIGGAALMIGVALGAIAVWTEMRRRRAALGPPGRSAASAGPAGASPKISLVAGILAALAASSCSVEPSPIEFGKDACEYCRMTIADPRYGAELVTKKGRVYKYDSIECLVNEMSEPDFSSNEVKYLLTVDYASPERLVDARRASYLHSPALRSPMGMNLTSFADASAADKTRRAHSGDVLSFDAAADLVRSGSPAGETRH